MDEYDINSMLEYDIICSQHIFLLSLLADLTDDCVERPARRYWVHPLGIRKKRQGFFHNLVKEMRLRDHNTFRNFHRMYPFEFDKLLNIIGPRLQRDATRREIITPAERLSLTLRYLASGDFMVSIGKYGYRIGKSITSKVIRETCSVIWDCLLPVVLAPKTEAEWRTISSDFEAIWNFPNCLGAIDGKHVNIQAFGNSGSSHFNYKHQNSVVLMAVCDARYRFTMVDIGSAGRNSDGGIFRKSIFGSGILNRSSFMNFPADTNLPGTETVVPFNFVGDEAFPLLPNLMRPYPGRNTGRLPLDQKIFNYRLSRCRRTIENAFGILASKFRIFRRPINASRQTLLKIIQATICLHNWMIDESSRYIDRELVDRDLINGGTAEGQWRSEFNMQPIGRLGANNSTRYASNIRKEFTKYFTNDNPLSWQQMYIE